jgi:hypothetical protein
MKKVLLLLFCLSLCSWCWCNQEFVGYAYSPANTVNSIARDEADTQARLLAMYYIYGLDFTYSTAADGKTVFNATAAGQLDIGSVNKTGEKIDNKGVYKAFMKLADGFVVPDKELRELLDTVTVEVTIKPKPVPLTMVRQNAVDAAIEKAVVTQIKWKYGKNVPATVTGRAYEIQVKSEKRKWLNKYWLKLSAKVFVK